MKRGVVIVSGGSRGLGASLVKGLLDHGMCVASFSRSKTPFLEEQLEAAKDSFHWSQVDASDGAGIRTFVRDVFNRFGAIDGLVNCAAVAVDGLLTLTRADDIERMLSVNLAGPLLLTQACAKVMLASRRGGSIINITSINGIRGNNGVAVYSATKAALDGATRALAKELGPGKIRVNSVAPGYFESEMTKELTGRALERIVRRTPLARLGSVNDMVGITRFLLSDEAAFITGQVIVVDGGLTC